MLDDIYGELIKWQPHIDCKLTEMQNLRNFE